VNELIIVNNTVVIIMAMNDLFISIICYLLFLDYSSFPLLVSL